MLKKILLTLSLSLFAILSVHSPTPAAVQIGMEAELNNEHFTPSTANLSWWLTDHWVLRGNYSWNTDNLGAAALYEINPKDSVAFYFGLAETNLSGADLSSEPKTTLVTGIELRLSPSKSGLSLMIEAGIDPNNFNSQPGQNSGLISRLGISLNYRFPPMNAVAKTNDNDAAYLLAKLIMLEALDEPFEGQVAVAAVVLNRTRSNVFPDSIREVIYERGQFHTARKLAGITPDESAVKAARAALRGSDPSYGALYFYNPAICSRKARRYFKKAHYQVTARIGNHVFLR